MEDPVQFFSYWLQHPNIRTRPQTSTIFDIVHTLMAEPELKSMMKHQSSEDNPLQDCSNPTDEDEVEGESDDEVPPLPKPFTSESAAIEYVERAKTPPNKFKSGTSALCCYQMSRLTFVGDTQWVHRRIVDRLQSGTAEARVSETTLALLSSLKSTST